MATFRSGTSNLELTEKNKKAFPPEFQSKSRLTYYSSLFNSIEINSTFYKLPLPSTLEKWAREVPATFRFTLKVWREITHSRDMAFTRADVEKFMNIANHMGERQSVLLIQFPAATQGDRIGQLGRLLQDIEKFNHGWRIAVEFRHQSWYDQKVYDLLDSQRAALVWHDRPVKKGGGISQAPDIGSGVISGQAEAVSARGPFIYLRFHGPNGDYKGSYSDDFLKAKAHQTTTWLAKGKDVYAYFNNTMNGDAPKNLITLNKMMSITAPGGSGD